MKQSQYISDKIAVSLSFFCMLHCLALPLLLALLPAIASLPLGNEAFHKWMLLLVIPTSIFALSMGCKQHKRYRVLLTGLIGLSFMIAAVVLGHDLLGERGEKALTVIGACIIAAGHFYNYRLCNQHDSCQCPEHHS